METGKIINSQISRLNDNLYATTLDSIKSSNKKMLGINCRYSLGAPHESLVWHDEKTLFRLSVGEKIDDATFPGCYVILRQRGAEGVQDNHHQAIIDILEKAISFL